MVKIAFFILVLTLSNFAFAEKINPKYLQVFSNMTELKELEIPDPISDEPINTKILQALKSNEILGYIREISTTTGCNSACLPIIYRAFHSKDGKFISLQSDEGLTKKDHAPFTEQDYLRLESIAVGDNPNFEKLTHPTLLTDALSGATLPVYREQVVEKAAYTSLRVYLYSKQTEKFIKSLAK